MFFIYRNYWMLIFLLLKKAFTKKREYIFQLNVNHVDKIKFLKIYKYV